MLIVGLSYIIGISSPIITSNESTITNQWSFPDSYFETNRFTMSEDSDQRVTENLWLSEVDTIEVAKNEHLILSVDPDLLSIYVTQRDTGYVWSSTLFKDYASKDDQDNPIYPQLTQEEDRGLRSDLWRNRIDSPVWLKYYTGGASPQLRVENLYDSVDSYFTLDLETNGFSSEIFFGQSNIAFRLNVTLTDKGVKVIIPPESIEERGTQKLGQLAVYPFFGAAKHLEIPGYFLVPDGSGALIRLDHKGFDRVFEKAYYGKDFSVDSTQVQEDGLNPSNDLSAPIYGMVHGVNNQGFLAVMHQGSTYASLILNPGTITTDFHFGYLNYTFRTSYRQPLNQSQSNTILRVQEDINPVSIEQEWIFLANEDANYVGMANTYKDVLKESMSEIDLGEGPSIHLDILMSENEKAFIGRNTFVMTHVSEVIAMVERLKLAGYDHLTVTLRGTSKDGYSGQSLQEFPVGSHIGSQDDFDALFKMDNLDVYLYVEPTKVYAFSRQSRLYDVSVGRHLLTYRQSDSLGTYDRIHPEDMMKALETLSDKAVDFGFDGLMLDTIGHTIYASFGENPFSRLAMQTAIQNFVGNHGVINAYAYSNNAKALFDVSIDHSFNQSYSDAVPFITYALNGLRPLYSGYLNYSANFTLERLRMLDFHVYPSYFVTTESAYALLNTPSNNYYTSAFQTWENVIIETGQSFETIARDVHSLKIQNREILSLGVVLITYENGSQLLINYRSVSYRENDWDVAPQSASFMEVNQ